MFAIHSFERKNGKYMEKKYVVKKKYVFVGFAMICVCMLLHGCGLVEKSESGTGQLHVSKKPLLESMQSYDEKDNALETWAYSYDDQDRLIGMVRKQANPDNGEMTLFETDTYEYFEDGTYKQTIEYHIDSGEKHVITYDSEERQIYNITDIIVKGNSIHTEYDTKYETKKGMQVATTTTVGSDYYYTTTETFNEHGDVVVWEISDSEGNKSTYSDEYTYDQAGRMVSRVQSDGAGLKTINNYEFEGNSKTPAYETRESLLGLPGSELTASKMKISYNYDEGGNLVEEIYEYEKLTDAVDPEHLLGKVVYTYQK